MISRDPDKTPDLPPEVIEYAQRMDKKLVHVICDPPNAKHGDLGGVSFFAVVDFIPRVGETIITQDKVACRVVNVYHQVFPIGDAVHPFCFGLCHNVSAVVVDRE